MKLLFSRTESGVTRGEAVNRLQEQLTTRELAVNGDRVLNRGRVCARVGISQAMAAEKT